MMIVLFVLFVVNAVAVVWSLSLHGSAAAVFVILNGLCCWVNGAFFAAALHAKRRARAPGSRRVRRAPWRGY